MKKWTTLWIMIMMLGMSVPALGSNEYQQDETEHAFPYRPYGI